MVPSNGFENALVLCLNCFLSQIWDTFAFFDLGLECIFWLWETWLEYPPCFSRNYFLWELLHKHTLGLITL